MTNKDLICGWCGKGSENFSFSNFAFLILELQHDKMTKHPNYCPNCGAELYGGLK